MSKKFPEEAPLLTLQSIYHVNQTRLPYKQVIQEYAYNPTWSAGEAIEHLKVDLVRFIDSFRESSKREGKLNV